MSWAEWDDARAGGTMARRYDWLAILCLLFLLVAGLLSVGQSVGLTLGH